MLLQSLRAPSLAPGGPGSIWNYLGAPVRSTRVSGRFMCGFQTDLHFADAVESVQSTLGIDHPGNLVEQLPVTPSDNNTFC